MKTASYSNNYSISKITKTHKKTISSAKKIFKNIYKKEYFKKTYNNSSILKQKKGIIYGRLAMIDSDILYLNIPEGVILFNKECESKASQGDIVKITFFRKSTCLSAVSIEILTECKIAEKSMKQFNAKFNIIETLSERTLFFRGIHDFFGVEGFIEINTPTLVQSPGVEKYLEPFSTVYHDFAGKPEIFFMPTSPEFSLKEALTSGLQNIYELAKCFRNHGENSDIHKPEFIMLEWYRAYSDYQKIIKDCADLILYLNLLLNNSDNLTFKGNNITLKKYRVTRLKDLFIKNAIDLDTYTTDPDSFVNTTCNFLNISSHGLTKEDIFFKYMLEVVEPALGFDCPDFITEYPIEMTQLSEVCPDNPLYGKRFELYICGIELANGYGELTSPDIQKKRFSDLIKERSEIGASDLPYPSRFIEALNYGIPPCSGVALGTERLFMILKGIEKISDTELISFKQGTPKEIP